MSQFLRAVCAFPVVSAMMLGITPSQADTQQATREQASRIFNPVVNPVNPEWIAFETLEAGRQELKFKNLRSSAVFEARRVLQPSATEGIVIPGMADDIVRSVYSGSLDWRPSSLSDGRMWFAYFASQDGSVRLRLNYIDQQGLVGAQPLEVARGTNGSSPRWSPNGKHLAFLSDQGMLHVAWNVDQILKSSQPADPVATLISQVRSPAFAPAWSPSGGSIAYQVQRVIRGETRYIVEVLAVDTASTAPTPITAVPVPLTDGLAGQNAYRPSWSWDGRYLAFYSARLGRESQESTAAAFDIRVVEAQTNRNTGRIFRGELLSGRNEQIAENVIPNDARGPSWTAVSVQQADGQAVPTPALVFVQRDDARGNPVVVAFLEQWRNRQPREASQQVLSTSWGSVNHREVSATRENGKVVYAFTAVRGGGDTLQSKDLPASWATRTVVRPPEPLRIASSGLMQAVLLPGGGQWATGRKSRGALYTAAALAGGAFSAIRIGAVNSAAEAGRNAPNVAEWDGSLREDYNSARTQTMLGAGVLAGAWVLGIVDAAISKPGERSQVSLRMSPAPRAYGYGVLRQQVGVHIAFGGAAK